MIVERLNRQDNIIYYDLWRKIPCEDLRCSAVKNYLIEDLIKHNIAVGDVKNFRWVVDLQPEGIDSTDIEPFYQALLELGVPSNQFRVIFSCVQDTTVLSYPAISLPDRLIYQGYWYHNLISQNVAWSALPMTYQLVCLMRRPSLDRAHIARRLLRTFKKTDLMLTLGTNGTPAGYLESIIAPHPWPIIGDDETVDNTTQHKIFHERFYCAPVNLVVESSSQIEPNTWNSIFITEKTFKVFAWHQFPLWYAVPGLVAEVRKLGFDVFDDLFDNHCYDTVDNPWARMTQVIQLARKISPSGKDLRQKYWQRLVANAERIEQLHTSASKAHREKFEKLINQ